MFGDPSRVARPELRRIGSSIPEPGYLDARVLNDELAPATTVVVSADAPAKRLAKPSAGRCRVMTCRLAKRVSVEDATQALGQAGRHESAGRGRGETNAAFFEVGLVDRVTFFYAPKILGGRDARTGVAGEGCRWRPGCRWKKSAGEILAPT